MNTATLDGAGKPIPRFIPDRRFTQWRYSKDRAATVGVTVGGLAVIAAVVLIFFYLLSVVLPLFSPASMEEVSAYRLPASDSNSLKLSIEEQGEIGMNLSESGEIQFFDLLSGRELSQQKIIPADRKVAAIADVDPVLGTLAIADDSGAIRLMRHVYRISYPNDIRVISPGVEYPLGETPILQADSAVNQLALREGEDQLTVAWATSNVLKIARFDKTASFFSDEITLEETGNSQLVLDHQIDYLLLDPLQDNLYVAEKSSGRFTQFSLLNKPEPVRVSNGYFGGEARILEDLSFLAGGLSLVAATDDAVISQWFTVRNEDGVSVLRRIREFSAPSAAPIQQLMPELSRRGFVATDSGGNLAVYHATAEQEVIAEKLADTSLVATAISPRADRLLALGADGRARIFNIENKHPEVSWSALWNKVWYESYSEPEHVWQSSSASNDFEPKLSLAPLSFGTLKAAFYAMLVAIPLAIGGAICTAYFMSSGLRQSIKPTIEVMEALPTVILGFLAGLFLAPFMETHLPGVFLLLILLPLSLPLAGFLWLRLPANLRNRVPEGWEAVLLIPVILLVSTVVMALSEPVEMWFFGGNMPGWLTNEMGIDYDQRNSLVVGFAMGFAVIPTIFSITEDAIFSVPKQLTFGSLALGATPWQTLVRVVLPTASPGIFSAVMIGMGRAVGETMIVLMATGNTPIMDMNIFEGMRTLSANIAVEMPESEVGSTHFRILFLAGLVLFLFTFAVNTLAELIRQRLRSKYSTL